MKKPTGNTLEQLTTESPNPKSEALDTLNSLQIVELINAEDAKLPAAVAALSPLIAQAIDVIAERLSDGGRLIYIGAGTSGRLGVLDAVECPPTFGTPPEKVLGLIAGGPAGLLQAIEGAEDSPQAAVDQLQEVALTASDVVVGIAASGRTPFVLGALDYARHVGAYAIGFCCNQQNELSSHADLMIVPVVGPEVLAGSTRMKAGTATKMVLNMLTTGAMVRLGKSYGNLMVDLQATNQKLTERALRMVQSITSISPTEATVLLERCSGEVKTAIAVQKLEISPESARRRLKSKQGHLHRVLGSDDER